MLDLGIIHYYVDPDLTLNWRSVAIPTNQKFPFLQPVIVDTRQFNFHFSINNIVPILEDATLDYTRLILSITDEDADSELIFVGSVTPQRSFKIRDLTVHFNTIVINEGNISQDGSLGTDIELGVALE